MKRFDVYNREMDFTHSSNGFRGMPSVKPRSVLAILKISSVNAPAFEYNKTVIFSTPQRKEFV